MYVTGEGWGGVLTSAVDRWSVPTLPGTHDVLPPQQPEGLPRHDSTNNSRGESTRVICSACAPQLAAPPRSHVFRCSTTGVLRDSLSAGWPYRTAPSHLPASCIPPPSHTAPSSAYPRQMRSPQLRIRHAIQVLSLVGDGCRFLGLPPPLRDMLLTGVQSAVPSSQRRLSIGSDCSTSGPLSAIRLPAPAARACISVKRRIHPSN